MPTSTTAEREERRGRVALMMALHKPIMEMAEVEGVHRNTITNDIRAIEESVKELTPAQAVARMRGVSKKVLNVFSDAFEDKSAKVRFAAAGNYWNVYKDVVALEQAYGMFPKKPAQVDVRVNVGEDVAALLKAIAIRMGMDEADELKRTLEVIASEEPRLLSALGLHP